MNQMTLLKAFGEIEEQYLSELEDTKTQNKTAPKSRKKLLRNLSAFAAVAAMFAVIVFFSGIRKQTENLLSNDGSVSVVNQMQSCDTLAQAEELAGFSIQVPSQILDVPMQEFFVYQESEPMIEINYASKDDLQYYIRKTPTSDTSLDDISGDYNDYDTTETLQFHDISYQLTYRDSLIHIVTWQTGDYSYCFVSLNGISLPDLQEILAEIS